MSSEEIAYEIDNIIGNESPRRQREIKEELFEVLDYIDTIEDWKDLKPSKREKLMEEKWMDIKWRKFEEWQLLRKGVQMGEKTCLKVLEEYGYSKKQLRKLLIKFGDVGIVGEYVKKHRRQKSLSDYF